MDLHFKLRGLQFLSMAARSQGGLWGRGRLLEAGCGRMDQRSWEWGSRGGDRRAWAREAAGEGGLHLPQGLKL